jgi:O-antigen/teichoic acid export membrane protein
VLERAVPITADSGLRGRERSRRLFSGIVTAVASRGIGAIAPLLLIPLTLSYLGTDLYGLWMAATAVTSMALFADLGLGNGLLTKLAPCYASGDTAAARRYIATAYAALTAVAAGLCALLWLLAGVVPWGSMFNAADDEAARTVALVCLTAFFVNIPLALVQRVQYAYQQVAQSNIWQATGSLWSVALVIAAVQAELAPTVVIAGAVAGPVLASALNAAWVFGKQSRELRPRPGDVDRTAAGRLLRLGGKFFVLSVVTSLAMNADSLVIAHALGLDAVTEYSVPARLFTALGVLVTLVNLPLWPANGEALARGDVAWVRKTTRRMTIASGTAVLLPAVVLVLAGDTVLGAWLGDAVDASPWFLAGLAAWWLLLATASPRFMVQNATGYVRPQLAAWSAYFVLSLPVKWAAAQQFGIAGVAGAGAVLYAMTVWPGAAYGYRRVLSVGRPKAVEEAM